MALGVPRDTRPYLPDPRTIIEPDNVEVVGNWYVVLKVIREQSERIRALEDQVRALQCR